MSSEKLRSIYKLFVILIFFAPATVSFSQQKFPTADIEPFYDLSFTPAERDSLLSGLQEYQKSIAAIHQYQLDNHVPMSLLFNPLPPGFRIGTTQKPIDWGCRKTLPYPRTGKNLLFILFTNSRC